VKSPIVFHDIIACQLYDYVSKSDNDWRCELSDFAPPSAMRWG